MSKASWFQTVKWGIPAGVAAVLAWLMSFLRNPFDADFITNPDAIVRLERIRQLMDGHGWFQPALMRVSTDQGTVLHWSRPLDVLASIGAWPLSFFVDMQDAVLVSAMGLSLIIHLLTVASVFWVLFRALKAPAWAAGLGAISFLTLTDMMAIFAAASWPDHHGLMTLLFVVSLGLIARMAIEHVGGLTFGIVQGLAVWVSPESLVPLAGLFAGVVLVWLKDGEAQVLKQAYWSAIGFVGVIFLALIAEYSVDWPGFALDRLSAFSLLIACVVFAFWAGLIFLPERLLSSVQKRATFVAFFAALGVGLVVGLVPDSLSGPMANANVWFVKSWGGMFGDSFRLLVWDGWVLIGLAFMVLLVQRSFVILALLTPILVLTLVLSTLDSTRWIIYGETVAILILVLGFAQVWPRLQGLGDSLGGVFARAGSLTGFILFPLVLSFMSASSQTQSGPVSTNSAQSVARYCTVKSLLPILKSHTKTRVLAHPNVTPAILYYSKHNVVSVPIHPNAEAVHDSVRMLMATDDGEARRLMNKYGVGLVVMCPTGHEAKAYGTEPQGLYARALRGDGPKWLKPIETRSSVFRVFAVQN